MKKCWVRASLSSSCTTAKLALLISKASGIPHIDVQLFVMSHKAVKGIPQLHFTQLYALQQKANSACLILVVARIIIGG